jgi:hypothetical protein
MKGVGGGGGEKTYNCDKVYLEEYTLLKFCSNSFPLVQNQQVELQISETKKNLLYYVCKS